MKKINEPTREGYELGYHLARLFGTPDVDNRCSTCAFRQGTYPNGSPVTLMDAVKCIEEGVPFNCHEESKLCAGYVMFRKASGPPRKTPLPWNFSDEPESTQGGKNESAVCPDDNWRHRLRRSGVLPWCVARNVLGTQRLVGLHRKHLGGEIVSTKPLAGLWRKNPETPEGKYLVKRRDGSVVEWPNFVIGAKDPAGPAALFAYADAAELMGFNAEYVRDVRRLAVEFQDYRLTHGSGDPDRGRHRTDDPATIAEMRHGGSA